MFPTQNTFPESAKVGSQVPKKFSKQLLNKKGQFMANFLFWLSRGRFDNKTVIRAAKGFWQIKTEFGLANYLNTNRGGCFSSKTSQITAKIFFDFCRGRFDKQNGHSISKGVLRIQNGVWFSKLVNPNGVGCFNSKTSQSTVKDSLWFLWARFDKQNGVL
jgi:hypothetical protein